jgi:hypothetical protein
MGSLTRSILDSLASLLCMHMIFVPQLTVFAGERYQLWERRVGADAEVGCAKKLGRMVWMSTGVR